ncbi:MAG: hypothetical protein JF606_02170 [Burkholderiales bacterium]|nr:hypothetical protein [Burkholderiales bacterium]
MNLPNPGGSAWTASQPPDEQAAKEPEAWQSTRAQTQIVRDEDAYLEAEQKDVGRLVGDHLRELFVTCDAGPAMQQQFEHLHPEFIAIHDVATHSSRKLLAGIAAASKGAVQKLVIRRQGHGNTLATLEFVELPTAEGKALRVYSTEADADTTSRHALARTLLGFSTLSVILVGDVPGHSITGIFKPLHDDMITGPWPNRNLLLLPLSPANALVTQGMELGRGTGVNVRTTPHVTRPADAWNFISSTWGRLRQEMRSGASPASGSPPAAGYGAQPKGLAATRQSSFAPPMAQGALQRSAQETGHRSSAPLPLRPMPPVPSQSSRDAASLDPLSRYVQQLSELTGMVSVCIFEVATGNDLRHAGASPGPEDLATHGSDLLAAMLTTSRTLGLGHALPEAAITLGAHHLVLRAVPKHPGLAMHAVLDKTHANLTLARLQIMRMDALFEAPSS